ncbi:alpha/beta fold hydrolase [Paraburkholderia megapolitana]|uniref:alpha/beta fold hydrolase n=1 Tax=Paraburkholderia megapolitana TaxID=420953 RepID=UPI000B0A83AC|nr:alpha/beta hydrolase [Paraburkholderia megapolitana]
MSISKVIRFAAGVLAASVLSFSAGDVQAANDVSYQYANVDGIKIFYREAGDKSKPTLLLLHGFPSSSHEFRDLIPLIAQNFHVVAPDYPGMGYSDAPPADRFTPTFDNVTAVIEKFVASLGDPHLIVYMTDFGGPVGMRMAVHHPEWISGLIFQNAIVAEAGVDPARRKRDEAISGEITPAKRALAESHVSLATALLLYQHGARNPAALNPDAWTNDAVALANPDSRRIMTDLQLDVPQNVAAFPAWQAYLRTYQPRTLVVWGKNDPIFLPAGAEAVKQLVPDASVRYYDTGHFALEEDHVDIAAQINQFFASTHVRGRIESVQGRELTVLTREGARVQLTLPGWARFAAVKPFDRALIKPGSYIGTAATATATTNGVEALEVMVYREERRGTGEGHYDWDLAPGSTMTGATVTSVTEKPDGRDLNLSYGGNTLTVSVPKEAPVVTFAPATVDDLKPGAAIFAVAAPSDHGQTSAISLLVEKNGVKPPL